MTIHITTLENGLRVVSDTIKNVETTTLGVWLNVGSRHESKDVNGIAHVLEHMAFKGTTTRSAKDIAEIIENVGGYMNAYTSREMTAYYTRTLKEDAALGVDILADILQNSTFQEEEFKREQSVILQEIGQTYDTPDDIVFDYFQETCFPDQPVGRPILGTSENVQSFKASTVKNYMTEHYGAHQMVLAAAGNIEHQALVDLAQKHFTSLQSDRSKKVVPASYKGGCFKQERDLEQVHIILGFEGVPYKHEDYYAHALLSTILGGGMSSRLFQEIREKLGLVYSIYAYHSPFQDSGIFGIYAGTSDDKANKLLETVVRELKQFSKTDITQELSRAKAQVKASLMMSLESTSSRCEQLASQMHIHGKPIKREETLKKIESVTEAHIKDVAVQLLTKIPTLTTLGPVEKVYGQEKVMEMLAA